MVPHPSCSNLRLKDSFYNLRDYLKPFRFFSSSSFHSNFWFSSSKDEAIKVPPPPPLKSPEAKLSYHSVKGVS